MLRRIDEGDEKKEGETGNEKGGVVKIRAAYVPVPDRGLTTPSRAPVHALFNQ